MADQLALSIQNGKHGILNKQIIEIKKKIHLSEGQRKANFEESNVRKRENTDRLVQLKREIKELRMELARTNNNDDSVEHATEMPNKSLAHMKKKNLNEVIQIIDEDIVRYRRELDLAKYRTQRQQNKFSTLLQKYETVMNDEALKLIKMKQDTPLKKKIIKLENQLLRVNIMQMEANIIRKKYKNVERNLNNDATFYASWFKKLVKNIKEQNNEIQRLRKVKEEAIALRNSTREELIKEENESTIISQQQENLIQDYRKQVREHKMDLESMERLMPQINRHLMKHEIDEEEVTESKNIPLNKVAELEDIFMKLRTATGVTKTENVLERFLNQQATKKKLHQMQITAEEKKVILEKTRQQLTVEIEMRKFSETKDAEQNAEKVESLNIQIRDKRMFKENAELLKIKTENLIEEIKQSIISLCCKCKEMNETFNFHEDIDLHDPIKLFELLHKRTNKMFNIYNNLDNIIALHKGHSAIKFEDIIIETASNDGTIEHDSRPLFPMFPVVTTPGGQQQPSEDEDEIPSRNILKRQAQLIVDAKSRRKCFTFKR